MGQMDEFNAINCELLEEEIRVAMEAIGEKYGLQVKAPEQKLAKDGDLYQYGFQFCLPAREETVASVKEEKDYIMYAQSFGVKETWLGKEFTRGQLSYKVVGLRVAEPDKCIILQRSDGSRCHENGKLVARYMA